MSDVVEAAKVGNGAMKKNLAKAQDAK